MKILALMKFMISRQGTGVVSLVPHCTQESSWDCGLACVSMILLARGKPFGRLTDLHQLVNTEDLWTIDLAYLLGRYNIPDFTMYTTYIGVHLKNSSKSFYQNSKDLSADRQRIHSLFAQAQDKGIRVAPLLLDLDDSRRFLGAGHYAIIMLVDLKILRHIPCFKHERQSGFDRFLNCSFSFCSGYDILSGGDDFEGHYILLVGVDVLNDMFYFRDPGSYIDLCYISGEDLEKARNSAGTDHDAIVVKIK